MKENGIPEGIVQNIEDFITTAVQKLNLQVSETNQAKLYIILLFSIAYNSMYDVLSGMFHVLSNGKVGYISAEDTQFLFDVLIMLDYRIEKSSMDVIKDLVSKNTEVLFDEVVARLGISRK